MRIASRGTAPLLVLILAGLSSATGAQSTEQERVAAAACTYDRCALRIEGRNILQGREGRRVARFRLFGTPQITPHVASSDSALAYARFFEHEDPRGRLLVSIGALTAIVALELDRQRGDFPTAWAAVAGVGAGVEIWGVIKSQRATRALSKSIWWYNRDLPR